MTTDRDLKFYIWLLTHKGYPHQAIRDFEDNQKVKNFDEFDTIDSRGLQYVEKEVEVIPERAPFEYEPYEGLLWDYGRRKEYEVPQIPKTDAAMKPTKGESIQAFYVYGRKKEEPKVRLESHVGWEDGC